MSSTILDLPSEYFLDSVLLTSDFAVDKKGNPKEINLLNMYTSIVIHEKISSTFMYGVISITDTSGIIETLPIIGEERIEFRIKKKMADDEYFEVKGFVYKVSNRVKNPESKSIEYYDLCFITENAMINQTKRISKTYDGKVSEMVQKISSEYFKLEKVEKIDEKKPKPYDTILIEATSDNNKITIPNVRPIDALDFLTRFSYSGNGKDKDPFNTTFYFYQTRQGYFYQSLENIITKNQQKEKKDNYFIANDVQIKNDDIDVIDGFTVIEYRFLNLYDNFKSSNTGYYGGTNVGFDSLTKTIHNHVLNYSDSFDNLIHLEKNDTNSDDFLFKKSPEKIIHTSLPTKKGSSESGYVKTKTSDDIFYTKEEKIKMLKNTKRQRFNNGLVVEIDIPSNPYLNVNDIVELRFPSFERNNNQKLFLDDKYFSGDYIVIGIKHVLSNIENKIWGMTVTLLKDSYKSKVEAKK